MTDTTGSTEATAPAGAKAVPAARLSTAVVLAILSLLSYLGIVASGLTIWYVGGFENVGACGVIVASFFALVFGIAAAFVARSRWRWLALGTALASPLAGFGTFWVFAITEASAIAMWWWWILVAVTAVLYLAVAGVDVAVVAQGVRARGTATG